MDLNFHFLAASCEQAGPDGSGRESLLLQTLDAGGAGTHSVLNVAMAPTAPHGPSPGGALGQGVAQLELDRAVAASLSAQSQKHEYSLVCTSSPSAVSVPSVTPASG